MLLFAKSTEISPDMLLKYLGQKSYKPLLEKLFKDCQDSKDKPLN